MLFSFVPEGPHILVPSWVVVAVLLFNQSELCIQKLNLRSRPDRKYLSNKKAEIFIKDSLIITCAVFCLVLTYFAYGITRGPCKFLMSSTTVE